MQDVLRQYFVNIFQQQHSDFSSVIDIINTSISENDNAMLTAPFTKAEFKDLIFSLHQDLMVTTRVSISTFGIYVAMIFLKNVVIG